ncbi:hypothetical protein COCVIDRAFT_32102 [Bipolaris victoriae FI3]|uniref:Uncharacterized protein n=1 Tax=Bipolaris victoriae (strain FI3) TaxID=930091 RepID=W7E3A9_BIPV3|nr:hypothetical protein COCVIDRAFT_32102 [Bipolaris victoriae FI3]
MMVTTAATVLLTILTISTAQQTEPVAYEFGYSAKVNCDRGSWSYSHNPDAVCAYLPGVRLDITKITDSCRVFIYKESDCTGEEKQVHVRNNCLDTSAYSSIKAFCH